MTSASRSSRSTTARARAVVGRASSPRVSTVERTTRCGSMRTRASSRTGTSATSRCSTSCRARSRSSPASPLYDRADGRDDFSRHPDLDLVPTTIVERWVPEGWIDHPIALIDANRSIPRRTRVLWGAFVFTLGRWNVEVRQDPNHIYTGEEFALTLRSFTWGYDLFNPTSVVAWHRHHPEGLRRYISDSSEDVVNAHPRPRVRPAANASCRRPQARARAVFAACKPNARGLLPLLGT